MRNSGQTQSLMCEWGISSTSSELYVVRETQIKSDLEIDPLLAIGVKICFKSVIFWCELYIIEYVYISCSLIPKDRAIFGGDHLTQRLNSRCSSIATPAYSNVICLTDVCIYDLYITYASHIEIFKVAIECVGDGGSIRTRRVDCA